MIWALLMARISKSAMIRKGTKQKRLAKKDVPAPAEPINDGGEKYTPAVGRMTVMQGGEEIELTVSPFRELLAHKPRKGEHVPTVKWRQAVMTAAGMGMTQQVMADLIGINVNTLRNHYREELDSSRELLMDDVKINIYNVARDRNHKDSIKAGMFLLSKLGGEEFRDRKSVELSGPDGKPLQIDQQTRTIDPTLLSHDQRDTLRDILQSALKLAQQPGPAVVEADYKVIEDGSE